MSESWEEAEEAVLAIVRQYFPNAKRTRGSGNVHADGDILGVPGIYVDVKDQSRGDGFTVKRSEWEKAGEQAGKKHPPKTAILAVRNKEGTILACCDLDLLLLALSYIPEGVL